MYSKYKDRFYGKVTGFGETSCKRITISLAVEWGGGNGDKKGGQ